MTHQPARSFSNSFHFPFKRAGSRILNVLLKMKLFITVILLGGANAEPANKLWPEKPFEHVVAYCYNPFYDTRGTAITFDDGSIHKGVIRSTTVRLDPAQTSTLRKILSTDTDAEHGGLLCYDPHHAFVFYDAGWKVAASIDICFLCSDYRSRPKGTSDRVDLEALKALCAKIGLPVLKNSSDYTKLFYQELPAKPEKRKQAEAGSEQPGTRPDSKLGGGQEPQPESERHSR